MKNVAESLGLNLNESELKDLIHKIDTSGNDKLEFEGKYMLNAIILNKCYMLS